MKRHLRAIAASVSALVAAGVIAVIAGAPSSAATPPPWQPEVKATGTLSLFDASGAPVTSGNLTDSPIAAYVQGSGSDTSHTIATLYGATPVNGADPGAWGSEQLSTSTTYPDPSAPGALGTSHLPLVHGIAGDLSLSDFIVDFPNNDTSTTDGYGGVYELRLKTGISSTVWQVADLQVTGSTWHLIYPATAGPVTTATVVTATPASPRPVGTAVTFTATLTPAGAVGKVQFKNGTAVLGAAQNVTAGKATLVTSALGVGTHSITAVFTPTNPANFKASTSPAISYVIT